MMLEDPLIAALDLNRPITAGVIDLAIAYHQAQADRHLAELKAILDAEGSDYAN